jgi:hypothetical protein
MDYATNRDDNVINLPMLESYLNQISPAVYSLQADSPEFVSQFKNIVCDFREGIDGSPPLVTFDISVTANRLILKCMKALIESGVRLRILYSEAASYYPSIEEYEQNKDRWRSDEALGLERGVSDVSISADIPGIHLDSLPNCVIIFPAFKAERSRAAITHVDPSLLISPGDKVIWLLGVPHHEEDRWRVEAMREVNDIGPNMRRYEVSTFDYKEALQTLEKIYEEMWECCNISLSPLGSKLQAVGTSLFCYLHPDVKPIFTIPKEYRAVKYSEGCKATWKLDFGLMGELRRILDIVGKLSVED